MSEKAFLAWISDRPDLLQSLLPRLPEEIFSEDGRHIVQRLVSGQPWEHNGSPPSEAEALGFLTTQVLALLGREAGRSQQTGRLDRLYQIINLLEYTKTETTPPPLDSFATATPTVRDVMPTGVDPIDEQIRGLAKGELGIIVAPPGKGKTNLLINFSVCALLGKYKVLYITVADQAKDELLTRFDTCILEEPCPDPATSKGLAERHGRAVQKIPGALWIADYTDRECSIVDIERTIAACPADLVVIDHADDVTSPYSADPTVTRHSLRTVYMTLKKLAVRFNIPIWTASQSHESSWHFKSTGITDMAEAKVGKATGAAIVLGFSGGPLRDQVPGVVWCTVSKARRYVREHNFCIRVDFLIGRAW